MKKHDVLLARQPIYNAKKEVLAYELLFRDSEQAPIDSFDGNRATSRVLLNLFTESDLTTVTGGLPAFVNFTADLIHKPPLFDPESIVIEVLEDIKITPELVQSIVKLKKQGFTIALDDFVMQDRYRPLLKLVDIVKLELPAIPFDRLHETITVLQQYKVKLLAEKVETPEQFEHCKALGCDMFQGYFLSRPQDVKGTRIAGNKLAIVSLIAEIQSPDIDTPSLAQVISRDPALSFKLLKLINSAAYRRSTEVESIHMAVNLLGLERIKSWASLLALSKIEDKPEALHFLALVRALMCEKLAEKISPSAKNRFYTVGLLSCLDAFIDQNISDIVENIALEASIKEALLKKSGPAGLALSTTINFEQSQWNKIDWNGLLRFGLDAKQVNEIYYASSQEALLFEQSQTTA